MSRGARCRVFKYQLSHRLPKSRGKMAGVRHAGRVSLRAGVGHARLGRLGSFAWGIESRVGDSCGFVCFVAMLSAGSAPLREALLGLRVALSRLQISIIPSSAEATWEDGECSTRGTRVATRCGGPSPNRLARLLCVQETSSAFRVSGLALGIRAGSCANSGDTIRNYGGPRGERIRGELGGHHTELRRSSWGAKIGAGRVLTPACRRDRIGAAPWRCGLVS